MHPVANRQPLPPPAAQYREISGGKVFRASVPVNWTALPSNSAIKVVPDLLQYITLGAGVEDLVVHDPLPIIRFFNPAYFALGENRRAMIACVGQVIHQRGVFGAVVATRHAVST